jgi:hypothetical protein
MFSCETCIIDEKVPEAYVSEYPSASSRQEAKCFHQISLPKEILDSGVERGNQYT